MRSRLRETIIPFIACCVKLRLLLDQLQQVGMGAAVHAIDLVVHLANRVGQPRIAFQQ